MKFTLAESRTSALLCVNAPAAFAKFMTDSVESEVAPPPTPYIAGDRRGGEWRCEERMKVILGRSGVFQ